MANSSKSGTGDEAGQSGSFKETIESIYSAHAAAIGQVAMVWNLLHEEMAFVFSRIVTPERRDVGFAAWHAIKNDRSQRTMLKAVAKARFNDPSRPEPTRFCQDLCWALDRIDTLSKGRNSTLHSPFEMAIEDGKLRFVPDDSQGHGLAAKLKGKDLEVEFKSYAEHISLMDVFISILGDHMESREDAPTWPERPEL